MSQPKTLEAKVIYRSNHSQLAMISIMKYGGIWERLGLEVSRMDLERRALPAEDQPERQENRDHDQLDQPAAEALQPARVAHAAILP